MCTVIAVPRPQGGYLVAANRDELHSRSSAIPPFSGEKDDGVVVVAPRDPDGGGTWIAANSRGLTVTLLNGDSGPGSLDPNRAISRGLIVDAVSASCDIHEAKTNFDREISSRLCRFRPFRLLIVEAGVGGSARAGVVRWNGRTAEFHIAPLPLVAASSSFRPPKARQKRLQQLQPVLDAESAITRQKAENLLASHRPRRGPYSVCMHRDDASTVSQTFVEYTADRLCFDYLDGPPCDDANTRRHTTELEVQTKRSADIWEEVAS